MPALTHPGYETLQPFPPCRSSGAVCSPLVPGGVLGRLRRVFFHVLGGLKEFFPRGFHALLPFPLSLPPTFHHSSFSPGAQLLPPGSVNKSLMLVMKSCSVSARPVPQITPALLCWHLPGIPWSPASPSLVLENSWEWAAGPSTHPKINPDLLFPAFPGFQTHSQIPSLHSQIPSLHINLSVGYPGGKMNSRNAGVT